MQNIRQPVNDEKQVADISKNKKYQTYCCLVKFFRLLFKNKPANATATRENKMEAKEIKSYRSEIDKTRSITSENFVLSFARKVGVGNVQHVFMVLEGINEEGHRFAWYADLTMRGNQSPDNKFSRVNIDEKSSEDYKKPLLPEIRHNALRGVEFAAMAWNIDEKTATQLKRNIEDEQKEIDSGIKTIPYIMLGKKSSHARSSSKDGHSCFSWAQEKINSLGDEVINIKDSYLDYIVNVPSIRIPDTRENRHSFWTHQKVAAVGVACLAVGIAASQRHRCTIL